MGCLATKLFLLLVSMKVLLLSSLPCLCLTFFLTCCSCLDFGLALGHFHLSFDIQNMTLCCLFIYISVCLSLNFLLIVLFIIVSVLVFPSILLRASSHPLLTSICFCPFSFFRSIHLNSHIVVLHFTCTLSVFILLLVA